MAKFLNKKEQVFDLELTSYGKYLFAIGKFKPVYYAFYDDNVIYDGAYAHISESQNKIHTRIKQETPYIESLVLFEDIDNKIPEVPKINAAGDGVISINTVPMGPQKPRFDNFRYYNSIGDSLFDGKQQNLVPAWKVVSLSSKITSSALQETDTSITELDIPQVNISLSYRKEIKSYDSILELDGYPSLNTATSEILNSDSFTSAIFSDDNVITLEMDDPVIYIDELNTEVLTENFDIEVFILEAGQTNKSLKRKYFREKAQQVVDGLMISENPDINYDFSPTTDSIEYYFDILRDNKVNQKMACKLANKFNKSSFYISLDFDCEQQEQENFYNDIYGSEVVPEICLD